MTNITVITELIVDEPTRKVWIVRDATNNQIIGKNEQDLGLTEI